jgi:hypothetical protein
MERDMGVFQYIGWGTERPKTKRERHQRMMTATETLGREEARRIYEGLLAICDREVEYHRKEIELVDACTPGGRYNRDVAASVMAKFASDLGAVEPVKRGRGRPRKYQPGDPRPPRKSRAKVRPSSIERASGTASGSAKARTSGATRRASSRTTSGTVSPVTAAPARIPTPAPKAAPKVAAALLESTLAGGLGVDTFQIEARETAFEIKPVETRTVQITVVENDPEFEAELAEQAARAKALLDAENEPGEEVPLLSVRRTKFTRRYDFSDAKDASKVDPAVLALFPQFGLSTTSPNEEMTDEDMTKWIFAVAYRNEPNQEDKEEQFEDDLRIYRSVRGIYEATKHRLDSEIQRERDRVAVWHVIDARVTDAEQFSDRAAKGEMSDDLGRMWVAHLDYLALGNLEDSEHLVWREIVDAMEWPQGFSRIDLALWAEQDPNVVPDVRSWAGEPKNFPERLRYTPFPR